MRWIGRTALLTLVFFPALPGHAARPDLIRVLFVGNSYTYYNNLPYLLEQLADSRSGVRAIDAEMVVEGGASLADHFQDGRAVAAIRRGDWDYVVLQGHSTLGTFLLDGEPHVTEDLDFFHRYARWLHEEVVTAGAQTVFFLTWSRLEALEDQAWLNYAYRSIARELGARIAPIGYAWRRVLESDPSIELFDPDRSHPSPIGSYLSACVLFTTLTGERPVGLPVRIQGPSLDEDGKPTGVEDVLLVEVDGPTAQLLQRTAWEVRSFADGRPSRPDPHVRPSVPDGTMPSVGDLAGTWTGTLKVYPMSTRLELRVVRVADQWEVEARVHAGERVREVALRDFAVTEEGIEFIDANGPNGGIIKYRGAWNDGALIGTAEILVESEEPIYGMGTWELERQP